MEEVKEKYILIAVDTGDGDAQRSLGELSELLKTAGGETAGTVLQSRESAHPGTYLGSGKIEEVKALIEETGAKGVIADDELSPAAMKNLSDLLDSAVLDRTMLILDIFAQRATTREGKLQVELAELRYRMTRLTGKGSDLSRLGGGIGTRGPGETKLETDRRRIRSRIGTLKKEVEDLARHREVTRAGRRKTGVPVAAIVGYTNAGKSTLLNRLADADVLSEDKLFATLDPTTRRVSLPSGETVLFTDTVGFIHKLPHHLIDAFRSTLEEAKYADVIVHVVDSSDPNFGLYSDVVYRTLGELGIVGKPVITVYNKCDLLTKEGALTAPGEVRLFPKDPKSEVTVRASALTGEGTDALLKAVEELSGADRVLAETLIPFSRGGLLSELREYGQILSEEYREDGIFVRAKVPERIFRRLGEELGSKREPK